MMLPTIHLNGTSKGELMRQLQAASAALLDAIHAMQNAAPNGRDYYPQGDNAIQAATVEHSARITKVEDVRAEIYRLMEHVVDAEGGRK